MAQQFIFVLWDDLGLYRRVAMLYKIIISKVVSHYVAPYQFKYKVLIKNGKTFVFKSLFKDIF